MTADEFIPPVYLKNATLQSVLASSKLRTLRSNRMKTVAREQILDVGDGVKLQGFYSQQVEPAKGLVIFLHGWEGSEKSAYLASSARFFYDVGYDIFRLNLRDHGASP